MYISSCKSVDIGIDIVKYQEGFFVVVKIIKNRVSIINISIKVISKTSVKITSE